MQKPRKVLLMTPANDFNASAPELYRTLGAIEATLKQVAGAVETLAKAQNETTIAVTKMAGQIEAINGDIATIDKRSNAAQSSADEARRVAEKAHARIDRMVWTASGVGAGAGAIIGIVAPQLFKALGVAAKALSQAGV